MGTSLSPGDPDKPQKQRFAKECEGALILLKRTNEAFGAEN
jgi:hypothetical protein